MFGQFREAVEDKISVAEAEVRSSNKVMDLPLAVSSLIRPGMQLHIAQAYQRPNAAIYELCRQFWGQDPEFTISSLGFIANMVLLVHGRLARRLITTFCGDSYPFPGPNRIYQEACRRGELEIENWSILSFCQRLLAGALGVDWMPTHSIIGSSMEEENRGDFYIASTPEGEKLGMVRAMHPDITLVHAWAADPAGNVLLLPPYAENVHAVFASKQGALVTVEKILPTSFLRRYSHFVKIPGYRVKAVCLAPMGVHPSGASNKGLEEFEAYAEDEEFMLALRAACKDPQAMEDWTREWLHDIKDHDQYLEKLGYEKIWFLKGRAASDSWQSEMASRVPSIRDGLKANPTEMMVIEAARILRNKVKAKGYRNILAGIGASNLAAWKAWYDLRREDYQVELMAEVGFYGYTPRPSDPFIFNFRNIPTCSMLTDILTVLGSMVAAKSNSAIGILGAGQVDRSGNVNSTKIPEYDLFLVGSGGACDIALGADETMITVPQDSIRIPERVSYITAPGKRVRTVVTTMGVFEKLPGEEDLALTAYFPGLGKDARESVEKIRSRCGWDPRVAGFLREVEPAEKRELFDIRIFDPRRYFLGEGEEPGPEQQ
jgi:acyl CoA:acetate/3-ketoacid CoA transferase alpha subunit/acyl CoA:acetate/3-ketoacid CoA transferase beta subunit